MADVKQFTDPELLLNMLELDLDMRKPDDRRVGQLQDLLNVAASRLARKGITLRDTLDDAHLQVSLAAWLYRRRNQIAGPAMPESLRLDINDRLIGEKAGAEKVRNLVAKHPRAAMLQNMQRQNDFFFCFLIRLSGLISSDLGGAYMGAVGISFLPYLAGSLLGMLPNMITFPIMGMNIRNIHSPEFLIAAGIQIGFTLLSIAFYALHRKRKCTDA